MRDVWQPWACSSIEEYFGIKQISVDIVLMKKHNYAKRPRILEGKSQMLGITGEVLSKELRHFYKDRHRTAVCLATYKMTALLDKRSCQGLLTSADDTQHNAKGSKAALHALCCLCLVEIQCFLCLVLLS